MPVSTGSRTDLGMECDMSTVSEYLADTGVTFTITSTGYQRDRDGWEHNVHPFTFTSATGTYSGTFRSGMAVDYPTTDGMPGPVDILASIALGVMGTDGRTFEEWAGDYGYSTDSIRALRTYEAIGAEAAGIRAVFGPDTDRILGLALAESDGCNYA